MTEQQGAASGPQFDIEKFVRRLKALYANWEQQRNGIWNGVRAFAVATPPTSEDLRYLKSSALQLWLLGYELPETVMLFLPEALHVICSTKKASLLGAIVAAAKEQAGIEMVLHQKPKSEDGTSQMQAALAAASSAGAAHEGGTPTLGVLAKEAPEGAVMERWAALVADSGLATVDVSGALCDVFAVKEDGEIMNVRKAGFLGAKVMKEFVVPMLEDAIDEERKVRHEELMEKTEEVITDPSKIKVKLKAENCDICYSPVFQSGGQFDLKPSAMSNDELLCYSAGGVIMCSIGARYDSYCSNLSRSYLVNPTPEQEKAYKMLLRAHEAVINAIRPGVLLCDVFKAATLVLEKDAPELLSHLTKNAGAGIGIEFRESGLLVSSKNQREVAPGMVFNVALGLQGLRNEASQDPRTKDYALLLADTVVVKKQQPPPGSVDKERPVEVATSLCSKAAKDVLYSIKGDEEEEEEEEEEKKQPAKAVGTALRSGAGGGEASILHASLRSETQEESKEQKRQKHQAELAKQKLEETARRLAAGGLDRPQGSGAKKTAGEVVAYRGLEEMPSAPRELMIQVDQTHEAVLLPIYGHMVPFHVSLIRTVSAQPDSGQTYVRFVLNVPGAGLSASDFPSQHFGDAIFLKEVSFRSSDARHANQVVQSVKAMMKQVRQRESERAERATLVTQERLQLVKPPLPRSQRLPDLWIRPAFATKGRKVTGVLEAHVNGFRYSTNRAEERVDVMYGNIKHALFQPAENEMITLLHFHLHNPIMVGKKKTTDVQFFAEVMDVVQTVGGSRRSAYDPDEIEEEQRERERRNKINREFEAFVRTVQGLWERDPQASKLELEFDVPFRDLGFHGVPHKASAFIVPSVNCLVELIEQPFFVVTLGEVEIVNLERVGLGQKTFDMAIVFKDFHRDVVRIDAIPATSLEGVKEWLNSMSIKYYESRLNLNWKPILQNIMSDPNGFLAEGGWEFLNLEASDSEAGSDEEEEAYEPSDVEEVGSDDEEESEDNESVVESEDEEGEEGGGGGGGGEEEEEEEEGLTWDELEEKARREDKELGEESDSEEERRRRRQRAGGTGGRGPGGSAGKHSTGMAGRPGMPSGRGSMGSGGRQGASPAGARPPQRRPSGGMGGAPMNRPRPGMSGGPPPKRPKY